MQYVAYCLIFAGLFVLSSCEKKECQNPPPTLRFMLMKANGSNYITDDKAGNVTIQYTKDGRLIRVSDVRLSASPVYAIESFEMIPISFQTTDTTHFYVAVGNETPGVIQLKTYVDNSQCDGWTHASELRFNGQVVVYDNLKPGYVLTP